MLTSLEACQYALTLLIYDKQLGRFRWRPRSNNNQWNERFAGNVAGTGHRGYVRIYVTWEGISYNIFAHRLVWVAEHGKLPDHEIDHKDRDRSNNRIDNLREASDEINAQNRGLRSDNSSGHTGIVEQRPGRWTIKIQKFGKIMRLGPYSSKEDAIHAKQDWLERNPLWPAIK